MVFCEALKWRYSHNSWGNGCLYSDTEMGYILKVIVFIYSCHLPYPESLVVRRRYQVLWVLRPRHVWDSLIIERQAGREGEREGGRRAREGGRNALSMHICSSAYHLHNTNTNTAGDYGGSCFRANHTSFNLLKFWEESNSAKCSPHTSWKVIVPHKLPLSLPGSWVQDLQ